MQPKCNLVQAQDIADNNTNSLLTAEKFHHACLIDENSKEIQQVLTYLFDPEKKLNLDENKIDELKKYMCGDGGGTSFEEFQTKSNEIEN